jgi:RNA polymerase sigma-70 factor (ECF subfamily)
MRRLESKNPGQPENAGQEEQSIKQGRLTPDELGKELMSYHRSLLNFVRSRLGRDIPTAEAEDVVSDIFKKALSGYQSFKGEGSFKAWLFSIAANYIRDVSESVYYKDFLPSLEGRPKLGTDGQEGLPGAGKPIVKENIDTLPNPETRAIAGQMKEVLQKIIATLPSKYREVLALYYFQELSLKEISEILQVPETTVKMRLDKGRKFLKQKVGDKAEELKDFFSKK